MKIQRESMENKFSITQYHPKSRRLTITVDSNEFAKQDIITIALYFSSSHPKTDKQDNTLKVTFFVKKYLDYSKVTDYLKSLIGVDGIAISYLAGFINHPYHYFVQHKNPEGTNGKQR